MGISFKNYDEIIDYVNKNADVVTLEMWQLRDAHGAGKLGVNVVANISEELERRGLGHMPRSLPLNQNEKARVYRRGSAIGKLISAARTVSEDADKYLRDISTNDAANTLKRIKELVCD